MKHILKLSVSPGKDRPLHKAANLLTLLLAPAFSYYLLEAITHNPFEIPFQFQLLGCLFSYLLTGFVFFLSGRMNLALILPQIFMAVLGTANYYVLACRQSPILPWDLASIGTAMAVAGNFTFPVTPRLVFVLLGYLALMAVSFFVSVRLKKHWKKRAAGAAATLGLSFLYVLCLQNEPLMNMLDVYEMPFTQDYTYEQNGFFVSFFLNTKYLKVDKPDGYSAAAAEKLLAEAGENGTSLTQKSSRSLNRSTSTSRGTVPQKAPVSSRDSEKPNIIVIMNEAFSDLSVIGDFEASEDYMPFFRSLYGSENTVSGNLHVSVLGGNTANT